MNDSILGVFATFITDTKEKSPEAIENRTQQSRLFREYLWGKDGHGGLSLKLNRIKKAYGKHLDLILFQYYVNPVSYASSRPNMDIENYRPKEKSIGVWINVDQDNFFSKDEKDRQAFLKNTIIERLEQISERLSKRELDININQLIVDVNNLL